MKKLVFMVLAACVLAGCSVLREGDGMTRAERKEAKRNMITNALDGRRYVIEVRTANPQRYTQVPLDYGYSLEIAGDTLKSYLPYYGRAYNIPYGGGKGLNFTAPISGYDDRGSRRGVRHIELTAKNDEDTYLYIIDVSDSGYATIDVSSRERERISFNGEMSLAMP